MATLTADPEMINRLRELRELLEKQQSAPEQETEPVLMPAPVVVG